MSVKTFAAKQKDGQLIQHISKAVELEMVAYEKGLLSHLGMSETPHLAGDASHLGMQHLHSHVNRSEEETNGSEVHHVFSSPNVHSAVHGLTSSWVAHGLHPAYLGQNSQGYHVIGGTDHLGRGVYAHIKQAESPTTPNRVNTEKPSPYRSASVAVTAPHSVIGKISGAIRAGVSDFNRGYNEAKTGTISHPSFPDHSGSNFHALAAAHGLAHYDTKGQWKPANGGGNTAHFSHLMTSNNPSRSITAFHKTISQSHPTTDVKYNRVRVGGALKHVYSFQSHDGKALHTTTVVKPAVEHPGGRLEWQ